MQQRNRFNKLRAPIDIMFPFRGYDLNSALLATYTTHQPKPRPDPKQA